MRVRNPACHGEIFAEQRALTGAFGFCLRT